MRNIEDEEAEIIAKEAKRDDESELTYDKVDDMPKKFDVDVVGIDPFDNDEVQGVLAEKDYKIQELDQQVQELAKYVNTGQVENHPSYKRLQERVETLSIENNELIETNRKLLKDNPSSTFKPAASFGGNLGQ
jgi:phage terminase large subunit-like protein